jgi:predicted nuclease of restriction endonuclease-like RecB superfamily
VLTKDLLRVSRAGGGYHPQFADSDDRQVAARVLGCYQGHVGESRHRLDDALESIERDSDDFKLVRGFAKLLERETTVETQAPVEPARAREVAFESAETVGVVTERERAAALDRAADRLNATPDGVDTSLYADRDERQILVDVPERFDPDALVAQYNLSLAETEKWDDLGTKITPEILIDRYNLSLAQTALFDATEVRIRSSGPRTLVTATKRLKLMYEVRKENGDWEVIVTGSDSLFQATRRYGTRFARLLRTVAKASEWQLTATIDDRGTERTMELSDDDPIKVPGSEPDPEISFDSDVEADFATRFQSVDLDWNLVREPEPLVVGESVMIPDFAFDYKFADYRVFFEIMGFWTPEYVEKKLAQLETVEDVEMLVAVDESLGVSEEIEARDHRAIPYSSSIRLKDVRSVLRRYEDELEEATRSELPNELWPDADAISLEELAAEHDVSESALEDVSFPEHKRVGRTLIRPEVLDELSSELESGMSLEEAEEILANQNITETSAVLSGLGYEVAWEGLSGGTLQPKTD